jgi:hypothetical protein
MTEYRLVRLKREWCPEWLWRLLARWQLPTRAWLIRWATTREISEHEDARINGREGAMAKDTYSGQQIRCRDRPPGGEARKIPANCPWCGSSDVYVEGETPKRVACVDCRALGPTGLIERDAIAAWNRRTPSPLEEAARDAVRQESLEEARHAVCQYCRLGWAYEGARHRTKQNITMPCSGEAIRALMEAP